MQGYVKRLDAVVLAGTLRRNVVAEIAAPVVELADVSDLVEGGAVAWQDADGNAKTGVIVSVAGLSDSPPTITVSPDDDPETPVVLAADEVEVYDGADDESDPADAAADDAGVQPAFDVVEDHPDCTGDDTGGTVAVIIFDDGDKTGEGRVDSCWPDTDAAQAHIEEVLASADDAPAEDGAEADLEFATDAVEDEPSVFVGEATLESDVAEAGNRSGLSELEHAASLAAQISETLELLHSIKPEINGDAKARFGLDIPVEGEKWGFTPLPGSTDSAATDVAIQPTEEPVVASDETPDPDQLLAAVKDAREAALDEPVAVVEEEEDKTVPSLADLSEDDLVAELARRYAESKVADIAAAAEASAVVETAVEAELEAEAAVEAPVTAAVEGGSEAAEEPEVEQPQVEDDDVVEASGDFDWEGVLIVEGMPSGDGRQVAEGALTWRDLPLPLMLQTVNADGHDGAIICGSIHQMERDGQNILGFGRFDSGAAGQEALRLLSEGTMRGVSADIDSVVVEFLSENGDVVSIEDVMMGAVEALEVLVEGRVMGATLCPFPAFQEAHVKVISSDQPDEAMVASGQEYRGDVWRSYTPVPVWAPGKRPAALVASAAVTALVASAAADEIVDVPVNPPAEWFGIGEMTEPMPFTVGVDGRCYGLVARFGSCHIGFTDRCVDVPRTATGYKHFRNKSVKSAEGSLIATGPIFMDTVHPNLRLLASDAQAHYADTGCAVADVALYENEFGIVAAGSLRPGLTEAQVRRFRGSDVSPDWRKIGGRLEIVGLLSVNVSGFVVESLVASGAEITAARGRFDSVANEVTALVAAGMVHRADFVEAEKEQTREAISVLTDQVTEMRSALEDLVLAPARAQRLAEARAKLGLPDPAQARAAKAASLLASMGIEAPAEETEFVAPASDEAELTISSPSGDVIVHATGDEAVTSVLSGFRTAEANAKLAEEYTAHDDCGCGGAEDACACEV